MNPWIRIARPPIVAISILGAFVGALNVTHPYGFDVGVWNSILIAIGAGSFAAALMIDNDVVDAKSDAVNRPDKPIPAGLIKPHVATEVAGGLYFLAGICSIFLTTWCFVLTITLTLVGIYYNRWGKLHGMLGHAAVAFGVGAIPLWGALAIRPEEAIHILPLALALMVMEVGREIMVCVGDYHGDSAAGWKTTPVNIGRENAMYVALAFYLASIYLFFIAAHRAHFGILYGISAFGFILTLLLTWWWCYGSLRHKLAEEAVWRRFEIGIRTGTRAYILLFQIILLLEAFY